MRQHTVIYQIKCRINNCNFLYVGQTKWALKERIKEHKKQWKLGKDSLSVVSKHRLFDGHEFDWENINILDSEINWKKRDISEMLHLNLIQLSIKKQIQLS